MKSGPLAEQEPDFSGSLIYVHYPAMAGINFFFVKYKIKQDDYKSCI